MARLNVLGALDLRDTNGRAYRSVLAQPKRVALLAYLALAGGFQRRDTLLALFWPETDDERARHSLNQGLYGLRRSLGAGAVVSRGPHEVGVDPGLVWCDAVAFQQAISEGRVADGLELYRDDLLKGFFLEGAPEFEQWVEASRVRLRDGAAKLAWAAAREEEATGNATAAAHWARRAVHFSRDDEAAFREFLDLLGRTGQTGVALREFEAFEKRLDAEYELQPEPATRALASRIAVQAGTIYDGRPDRPAVGDHTADPLTPFVGRAAEVARLDQLLEDPAVRLITIAGPAGAGKTRLVLHAASRAGDRLGCDVVFISLTSVPGSERLASAIAAGLRIERADASPARQVLGYLRERNLLLVLDNMDHLLGGAALLTDLLATAPGVRLLVTSREVLNLQGEWVFPLAGMAWSPNPADADFAFSDAPRLFVAAAQRALPSFVLGLDERACLLEILELVDGLPLGLELAAAWTRTLSLPAMVDEFRSSRLAFANPLRDAPQRHASLGAAVAYSWQHLAERERLACSALSVFRGGFSRTAAARVAGAPIGVLKALVDKSLVQRLAGDRYAMLEVIREYAAERLADDPAQLIAARDRHRDHFADLLQHHAAALRGGHRDAALLELDREWGNIRDAWLRAVETFDAGTLERALEPLFTYCDARGLYEEGIEAFRAAACACPASRPALSARLLARHGALELRVGALDNGEQLLVRALDLARQAGEVSESAFILDRLSIAEYERGGFDAARRFQEESLQLRGRVGDRHGVATSLNNLGSLAYAIGAFADARDLCSRCLELQRELDDSSGAVLSLHNLGCIEFMTGNAERGTAYLNDALEASRNTGSDGLVARSLYYLGNTSHSLGRDDVARRYFEAALGVAGVDPTPLALDILMGLAQALCRSGAVPDAVEILSCVEAHPAAARHRRHAAAHALTELRGDLAADEFAFRIERGRSARLADLPGYPGPLRRDEPGVEPGPQGEAVSGRPR